MTTAIEQVQAFKCNVCSSFHSTSKKAESCIKKCNKLEEKKQKEANIEFEREEFKQELERKEMIICNEAESLDDVERLFVKYSKEFLNVELNFSAFNFRFKEMASNSHQAPLGKKRNWGGQGDKDDIPKGYPGFEGRIEGTFKEIGDKGETRLCGSDFFDALSHRSQKSEAIASFPEKPKKSSSGFSTNLPFHFYGIHTGSGSGGKNSFSYSATIFIDDFPKIKAKYEVFSKLKEEKVKVDIVVKELSQKHLDKVNNNGEVQQIRKLLEVMRNEITNIEHQFSITKQKIDENLKPELREQIAKYKTEAGFDEEMWKKVSPDFG